MIQPNDLKLDLPMKVANGVMSTTSKVWEILHASYLGDLEKVKELLDECPALIYAQYNYAPPVHFAVREGHTELVKYLLSLGANDPNYRFYPFQEDLLTVAIDRGYTEMETMLREYAADPEKHKFRGDNGEILYNRTALQKEFEQVVDQGNLARAKEILTEHPEFALDETYFWGEGILLFADELWS